MGNHRSTVAGFDTRITEVQRRLSALPKWQGVEDDVYARPATPGAPKGEGRGIRRSLRMGGAALGLLLSILGIRAFAVEAFFVPSQSMNPTFQIGERFLVNKLAYSFDSPSPGDLIVFETPAGVPVEHERLVKRIVAIEGQTVSAADGRLRIDGQAIDEDYLPAETVTGDFEAISVPQGEVFVLGDNRPNSVDSRAFGPIRVESIVGEAVVLVWPPNRIGTP